MKPNVGDKVFVIVDLNKNVRPDRVCPKRMLDFIADGAHKTVRYVGPDYVLLVGDNMDCAWDFGWLFPVDDDFEGNV
jgi:hypothetical protein